MKKLLLILLTITMTVGVSAWGQTKKDATFKIVIDAKGGIHDHGGKALGYIDKENIVRNNKGQKLYFIDGNGNVIDANGKNLGMAKKNGSYYNVKGENILKVKDLDKNQCAILDPQGHNFGTAHANYKLHACAAHCYFLEHKGKEEAKEKAKTK